ncbi:efThoc1, Dak1 and/or Death domain containing protein [Asbolus verrucosus]|uniref:Triokinase/FMN cyclase n=1 Tax=Asbolus verrucosus TaxID=1661398 RepID=A0A482VFX5_ASBVE|nr:efThoc1, Dak1 and/or Death domain containing protein [Asbolus verrucosus]
MDFPNDSKRNLINEEPTPLRDSLLGLTALNQGTVLLDYGLVIVRRGYKDLTTVRLLSGGVAGRDLSHATLVGKGMLTAAILGEEAAPSSRQILRTIKELNEGENCGILVIAQANSELFNFGLAVERANANCQTRVKLLPIHDSETNNATKKRNSCGFIMLTKILGAMAESGAFYNDIWQCYKDIIESIITVPLNYLDEETGPRRHKSICLSTDFDTNVRHVIDKKFQSKIGLHPSIPMVALINTSKSMERLDELVLVKQVLNRLRQLGVCIVRMYLGNFVATAPGSASLTVMKIYDSKIIDYLDAPCEAPGWQRVLQFLPEVTARNEIPGLLTNQGKQRVLMKGPKLSEDQSNVLVRSVQFACDALISCEKQLNIIDAEKSEGNVGTRLKKVAQHVNNRLNNRRLPIHCPYAFLKKLSVIAETAIGGTMGSIYGILFESAANVFGEAASSEPITPSTWAKALTAATEAIKENCNDEMQLKTMYHPIKACEVMVNKEMEKDSHFIECYGLGITQAEEAAQQTRLSFYKYADAGAHADVLRKSFKSRSAEMIENKVRLFTKTALDLKAPLDQAFRDILLELLEQEVDVSVLREFVDFSVLSCRKELSNPTMPVVLLSDIFDALTLDVCQEMFLYVENNVEVWKENLFFSCCKNNLLRLCNDLLRRLSRSTATVFCGRILLFLAKFFPFSERSGLNIVSEFNLENTTEYGTDSSHDNVGDIEGGDKKNTVIDFTFYCKFWSLQDFFRNPNQLYSKVQWKLFCTYATSVLNTFHGLKLEHIENNGNYCDEIKNKMYFSKYLTSQKLLDLQLYDVNFRRAVLLQFLILFQYLSSSVKFKSDSFELKTDQKEWVQASTDKVYNLLRETPPDGKRFAEIASNILSREEYWNAWKNDGCPELKKSVISLESPEKRKSEERPLLGDMIKEASSQGRYYMGSLELTKLWNLCPDNLEACKGRDRDFLPTLEDYFSDAIAQMESSTSIKDEDNLLKDGNYGWRALRLLAKRSPHFFTYSTVIMNPLSSYLEMMVKKIAHDKPGRTQESSQESQQADAEEENLFKDTQVDEGTEDMKPSEAEEFMDDKNTRIEHKITPSQLQLFSEKIGPSWKKLASKLGFKPDEIQYFTQENTKEIDQAKNMLQLWFDDDEDATLDNFVYILEGLEMEEAAELVKNEINSMDT